CPQRPRPPDDFGSHYGSRPRRRRQRDTYLMTWQVTVTLKVNVTQLTGIKRPRKNAFRGLLIGG
ncbi:MAG: hypothetical protein KG029_03385, partial [Bacteroidetes bacterium]|nr:hypothetical protein [Bacteroidota bacterium]